MLTLVSQNRGAICTIVGLLIVAGLLVNWMAWIFKWGRFAVSPAGIQRGQPLRFVVANFFAEIINDFRHFLALVIVLVFAAALFAAMYPGLRARDITQLKDGVQAVAAALGGLIGSIIGYYFGESAASRKDAAVSAAQDTSAPVQQSPQGPVPGVTAAPAPPSDT